jgi:hypothetical protein
LVPLLSSASNGKPYIISLGGTKEPVEVDIGLAVLSLMQAIIKFMKIKLKVLFPVGCRIQPAALRMPCLWHNNETC